MNDATSKKAPNLYLPLSKVSPPDEPAQQLLRHSLLEQLTAPDKSKKLTLFNAPAGYGKSTVLRQVLKQYQDLEHITVWLNLDAADNDISRFLAAFSMAVSEHTKSLEPDSYRSMRNAELAHRIIETLDSVTEPTAIFFDNLDKIENPAVTGLITRGIEALPENCRVFVGSRGIPAIGTGRLTLKNQLHILDADALRFTLDDTQALLNQHTSNQLTFQNIQTLHQRTEGWPTALVLASYALEQKNKPDSIIDNFSGSNASVAAYLAQEVLESLTDDDQTFLLHSSIFDEIDVSICNSVLQREDSFAKLNSMRQRNLFVHNADEQLGLYQYHSLFRDFLYNQLQARFPNEVSQLHSTASQAFQELERWVPAIRHSIKAGNFEIAVTLLEHHAEKLLGMGRIGLLTGLLSLIPPKILKGHSYLLLIYALCATYTKGPRRGLELLAAVDRSTLNQYQQAYLFAIQTMQLGVMDQIEEAHELGMKAIDTMSASNLNARAILAQTLTQTNIILGHHTQARAFCDRARFNTDTDDFTFNQILAETAQSSIDLMSGRLKQASRRMEMALGHVRSEKPLSQNRRGITMASIFYAETLYEQGRFDEAMELLTTNSALVQDVGPPDALISASVILARIVESKGEIDHAAELLIELENSGHRLGLTRVTASARLERSRLWLGQGEEENALKEYELAEKSYDWDSIEDLWFLANDTLTPEISNLRWLIRTGEYGEALPIARKLLKKAERAGRNKRVLKLQMLMSEVLLHSGDTNSAGRALRKATERANEEGFVGSFLEEGAAIGRLLNTMKLDLPNESTSTESGLTELASQSHHDIPIEQVIATTPEKDRLTNKEMKVLLELAQGLSNSAIAERLFVSESTVRTHLRNVNLKLKAKNRTEAVSIARKMGMIS